MPEKIKKLYRSNTNKVIFGVCGGLGEYFDMDSNIFRLLFILLALTGGAGILIYLVFAIVIPAESGEHAKSGKQEIREFVTEIRDKAGDVVKEIKKEPSWKRNFLGFLLIVIGIVLLSKQIFPFYFSWLDWSIIWPILILLLGVKLLADNK
jgi:phage shock protein C